MTLFKKIRQRRLFQIVVSYAAAGWILMQLAAQLIDRGFIPELAYQLLLVWLVGGFPALLIAGWYHGEKGVQKAPWTEIAMLGVIAVVVLVVSGVRVSAYVSARARVAATESTVDLRRVAVMYFEDLSRDGELRYLADGLTEELIEALSQVRPLDVISRSGVAPFRGTHIARDSIGRLLKAGTLVDGSVEGAEDRVRINLRVVDGLSGAEFGRAGFERPAENLLAIRDEVVTEGSRLLREWLGEEIRLRSRRESTEKPAAWALVQRAEKTMKDAEALARTSDGEGMEEAFDRADAMLAEAELLDSAWVEPIVLRETIAFGRSRLAHDAHEAVDWIGRGLAHAERALARAPNHAKALELRGTLRYWHHLLDVTPDPAEHERLLQQARADLERAVELEPSLASAHRVLSHLYYGAENIPAAVLAARRAYEEDAYLESADEVLARLFYGSYDLEQFTEAQRWCQEGVGRFPDDFRFVECQIVLMTTPALEPDPEHAWRLIARLDSVPMVDPELTRIRAQMFVAGVLARAGLPDSARAVLLRARSGVTADIDPLREHLTIEAAIRTQFLGDHDEAIELLKRHAAINPDYSFEHHWWWRELRGQPRYREISNRH